MKFFRTLAQSPFQIVIAFVLLCGMSGCSSHVEVVDLNKVLDVMVETLQSAASGGDEEAEMEAFPANYAKNLNALPLASNPVVIEMDDVGTFWGIEDTDGDSMASSGETKLFKVEIDEVDEDTIRLVATDLQGGYTRDSNPIARAGTGILAGVLIGSMLSRRRAAGMSTSQYRGRSMSPKNYHSSAVQSAKAKARSRSGSGSFKSGK